MATERCQRLFLLDLASKRKVGKVVGSEEQACQISWSTIGMDGFVTCGEIKKVIDKGID